MHEVWVELSQALDDVGIAPRRDFLQRLRGLLVVGVRVLANDPVAESNLRVFYLVEDGAQVLDDLFLSDCKVDAL